MSVNLKSKKLIILIAVLVAIIAVIVILATVFSVRKVSPVFHNFDGSESLPSEGAPTVDDILKVSGGKSMFFMSKDWLLEELNVKFPDWHAFAVVKNFPNIIDVHFVKREAVVKIDIGGNMVYVDSFGYAVEQPTERNCVDISSVFDVRDATVEQGKRLQFVDEKSNQRLSIVLEAIITSWRCNVDLDDMPVILGGENVFTFDEQNNFVIHTRAGAQIKVIEPTVDLTKRLLSAYGVYYNDKVNLQQKGVVITVEKDGRIRTPSTK